MSRRTPETLADYLVVAVCPALIMLLLGSLLFFLVHVFYQGQFEGRLLLVLAMFTMAIVCITRIAMEEGRAYATLYAFPIAILVAIALAKFVQFNGPLAMYSGPINWTLMAIVWAAAHRLTWDCTVIDDSQDASGAGLLAQMGLDEEGSASGIAPAPEATTGTPQQPQPASLPWWQTILEHDRSPHPPGVWVVIFSLAALPLFGIGGRFIPEGDLELRRRCFWLLIVYVASGLALLLATSFLGLRRYLRQRRLEMPLDMAATWIVAGGVLIVATLIVASLIPRPSPEYSLAHLVKIDSLEREASRFAYGEEGGKSDPNNQSSSSAKAQKGQKADQSGAGKTDPNNQNGEPTKSGKGEGGSQKGKSGGGQQKGGKQGGSKGEQGNDQSKSGPSSKSKGDSGKSESGNQSSESDDQQSKSNGREKSSSSEQQASNESSTKGGPSNNEQNNPSSKDDSSDQQPTEQQQSDQQQSDQSQASSNQAGSSTPSNGGALQQLVRHTLEWFGSLGGLVKAVFYLAIAIAMAVVAWRYRQELLAAWQKLLAELRDLWARWFRKPNAASAEEPASTTPRPRSFADFADPFATGNASRMSPAELVRYTFQALEAWGRDNGCPRADGQTPHEFATAIGDCDQDLAREAQHLADLYSRLAYAPKAAIRTTFEPLRSLWQKMKSPAVVVV
jgi:hypothetical protein